MSIYFKIIKIDGIVKSHETVMPDVIRHLQHLEITGLPLPDQGRGQALLE